MEAAVFLDRDNTIIENDGDLGEPDKVRLIQGAASAIASLRGLGYRIVVITNQGGVARGKYSEDDVEAVHERINELVHENSGARIDRFYFCPFHPQGSVEKYCREHPWRKPQPGMLLRAAQDLDLDLDQSWMIGDAMRDVQAGAAAGVRTILLHPDAGGTRPPLRVGQERPAETAAGAMSPDFYARTLIEAVRIIAQQRRPEKLDEAWAPQEELWLPPLRRQEDVPSRPGVIQPPRRRPQGKPFRPWDAPPPEEQAAARRERNEDAGPPASEVEGVDVAAEPSAPLGPPAPSVPPGPSTPVAAARRTEAEPEVRIAPAVEPINPATAPEPPTAAASSFTPPATSPDVSAMPTLADPAHGPSPDDVRASAGKARGEMPHPASVPGSEPSVSTDALLRQLLQELRQQRVLESDFSFLRMFATVLQMGAVVCMGGGLWLGTDTDSLIRWFGAAVIVQLATLATLLFDR